MRWLRRSGRRRRTRRGRLFEELMVRHFQLNPTHTLAKADIDSFFTASQQPRGDLPPDAGGCFPPPTGRQDMLEPARPGSYRTPRAARPKAMPLGALPVGSAHPVLRRRDNGYWEMPGGVLEPAEQPEDGARREVILEAREARWMTRDEITAPWIHPMQSVCWVP